MGSGSVKGDSGKGLLPEYGEDLVDCLALFSHHINIMYCCVVVGVVVDAFSIPRTRAHKKQATTKQNHHQQQQ